MPKSCCAVGCHNHNMMKDRKMSFFTFPKDPGRREKWIVAMKRVNPDGTKWQPSKETVLCADHFISGKPNGDSSHPDFIPSVFIYNKTTTKVQERKIQRYESAAKRKISFSTPVPNKIRACENEDVWIATPLSSNTPLQELPPTPVSGLQRPVHLSEREELYEEINNLRKEKANLQNEVKQLQIHLQTVKLSSEIVANDNAKCKFYTGLTWNIFFTAFTFLSKYLNSHTLSHAISPRDQYFITLLKLRMDLPFEFLGNQLQVSSSCVGDIIWKWIELINSKLGYLIKWPDREVIFSTIPGVFAQKFPHLTCIVDCFEIFIERPRNLHARAKCYSNYKKHSTVKVFIACTANGSVSFLSCAWGGRVSDIEIVRQSGFIDPKYHLPGDQILADRGFTLQDDFASACGAELIIPAFTKGKKQLSAKEVEISRKISSVRIHIERIIGLLKNRFAILQGTLSIGMIKSLNDEADGAELARVDKLLRACAINVNLGDGIVYSEN